MGFRKFRVVCRGIVYVPTAPVTGGITDVVAVVPAVVLALLMLGFLIYFLDWPKGS